MSAFLLPLLKEYVIGELITVEPTCKCGRLVHFAGILITVTDESLAKIFQERFSEVPHWKIVLNTLNSNPFLGSPNIPTRTINFLDRMNCVPETATLDADDEQAHPTNYGHAHFTAGDMTITTVLTSWSAVGNAKVAFKLIGSAVRTCLVARHLALANNIEPTTGFVSDCFLRQLLEVLKTLLETALPVS